MRATGPWVCGGAAEGAGGSQATRGSGATTSGMGVWAGPGPSRGFPSRGEGRISFGVWATLPKRGPPTSDPVDGHRSVASDRRQLAQDRPGPEGAADRRRATDPPGPSRPPPPAAPSLSNHRARYWAVAVPAWVFMAVGFYLVIYYAPYAPPPPPPHVVDSEMYNTGL